jgi:phenylpropionate dioxygenase-like ring-hydroxylating dioxygenase large terminal subunit
MINDPVILDEWHPICRSDSVAEGTLYPVRLLEMDLVAWRSGGVLQVAQDLCVHRGARLSLGSIHNGRLKCPYHGWEYDENGHCQLIPAHPTQVPPPKARLTTYPVEERYGLIWICPGETKHEIPGFPEENLEEFKKVLAGPYGPVRACGTRIVENFLDVAHFPFIHKGILGDEERPEIPDYQIEVEPGGITATNIRVHQPDPYGTGEPDEVHYIYRVSGPLSAYLAKDGKDGQRLAILLAITPIDEIHSIVWFYLAINDQQPPSNEEMIQFQTEIFNQDVAVVESQRPQALPLDLQEELHVRCDRTAIAYRRWLKDKGMAFGVL